MNHSSIYLSREDHTKLRLLLAAISSGGHSSTLHKLRAELDRAVIVDSADFPADVVTLDSSVEYEDLTTGEIETYTLTLPERANVEQHRLSILAPVGTALIGCRVRDVVTWSTPGGVRQLLIRNVTPKSELVETASASIGR